MANYAILKTTIQEVIKQNGNNEITGALLQQSLLAMINSLGVGYQFMGVAVLTPTQTDPGTPDQNVFYIAAEPGIYANFSSLVVSNNEIAIFKYNGAWAKDSTGAASADVVIQIIGTHLTVTKTYSGTGTIRFFENLFIKNGKSFSVIFNGTAIWSTLRLYSGDSWGQEGAFNTQANYEKETKYTFTANADINKLSCFPTITTAGTISIQLDYDGAIDGKVSISDIVNALNSQDVDKPLSAKQGNVLLTLRDNDKTQDVTNRKLFNTQNLLNEQLFVSGYLIDGGYIAPSSSYKTSGYIPVDAGLTYYYKNDQNNSARLVAYYDSHFDFVANSLQQNINNFTIPNGVLFCRVSFRSTDTNFTLSTYQSISLPKYAPFIKPEFAPNTLSKNYAFVSGNLSAGDSISLSNYYNSIKKNERLMFVGTISSFSSVEIGFKRYGTNVKLNRIVIDGANITIYPYDGDGVSYAHGLTIQNNIQVILETDATYNVKITLVSNGIRFQGTYGFNRRYLAFAYAESVGSSLTSCVLSWTCVDFKKDIWMFGDSYFSYSDRWFYYFHEAGYDDNVLMDAFPGEDSSTSLLSLRSLLQIGKPKMLIWCLGMNDGTDGSTYPSEQWTNGIKGLLTICDENNIIPVLATVPTVPTINNERKNYYVRNIFGKQYIDFAKAVGANSSGQWFSGMLSNDGVHPTDAGAKALYMAVVTDAPQVMIK